MRLTTTVNKPKKKKKKKIQLFYPNEVFCYN